MAFLDLFGRAPELGDSVAEVLDDADVLADALLTTGSTGSTSPATGGGSGVEMEVLVVGPPFRGRPRIFFGVPSAGSGELVVESLSVAFASCNWSTASSSATLFRGEEFFLLSIAIKSGIVLPCSVFLSSVTLHFVANVTNQPKCIFQC